MEMLTSVLLGKPENILFVCLVFLTVYCVLRLTSQVNKSRYSALLIASLAWGAYAVWEWFVQAKTPEANIRFDLLVIWPIVAILSVWALYRVIRAR